jgi:hypothetical protein
MKGVEGERREGKQLFKDGGCRRDVREEESGEKDKRERAGGSM